MTPDGAFTILANDDAVLASGWTDDVSALLALIHPTLRQGIAEVRRWVPGTETGTMSQAISAVADFYEGDLTAPGRVPVHQRSGEFREYAWNVLRSVPAGERLTYLAFAARAGRPTAVRPCAGACAMNAAALFVPCHRVVRSDGGLGGFRYGLELKRRLLDREAAGAKGANVGSASGLR